MKKLPLKILSPKLKRTSCRLTGWLPSHTPNAPLKFSGRKVQKISPLMPTHSRQAVRSIAIARHVHLPLKFSTTRNLFSAEKFSAKKLSPATLRWIFYSLKQKYIASVPRPTLKKILSSSMRLLVAFGKFCVKVAQSSSQ